MMTMMVTIGYSPVVTVDQPLDSLHFVVSVVAAAVVVVFFVFVVFGVIVVGVVQFFVKGRVVRE